MDHNSGWSPASSGTQTPGVPSGSGSGSPQMGPGGNFPWHQMMQQMQGLGPGGIQGGMPGGGPGWGGVAQMQLQMMHQQMQQMQQQMMAMMQQQGGMRPAVQGSPVGDTVYRPTLDFLTASSHTSTPLGTQFSGDDVFSLEEMGIADTPPPAEPELSRRRKKKGAAAAVGEASQPASSPPRRRWTEEEYVGLSKAWLAVCDDPLVANNQRVLNMWAKIRAAYKMYCPHGKDFSGEDCRKGWERVRTAVGRFSGLYANALRQLTSGQTEEDARKMAMAQFPVPGTYKQFTYWACFEVLKDSEKFRAGCEAGWPKRQRLNFAGDYSGSGSGSHDLPPDVEEVPETPSFGSRPRPIGQRRAQRRARGGSPAEVMSPPPPPPRNVALFQRESTRDKMHRVIQEWRAATDPIEKMYLQTLLQSMKEDLDASSLMGGSGTSGVGGSGGGYEDVGGSGDGNGTDE